MHTLDINNINIGQTLIVRDATELETEALAAGGVKEETHYIVFDSINSCEVPMDLNLKAVYLINKHREGNKVKILDIDESDYSVFINFDYDDPENGEDFIWLSVAALAKPHVKRKI